jgi:hypothetical protein
MAKSLKEKIADTLFWLEDAVLNNNYRLPFTDIEKTAEEIIKLVRKDLKKKRKKISL